MIAETRLETSANDQEQQTKNIVWQDDWQEDWQDDWQEDWQEDLHEWNTTTTTSDDCADYAWETWIADARKAAKEDPNMWPPLSVPQTRDDLRSICM